MKFQGGTKLTVALCCCAILEGQLVLGVDQSQQPTKKPGFFARLFGRRSMVTPAPERPFDDIRPDESLERPPVRQAWGDNARDNHVSFDPSIVDKPLSPGALNEAQVTSFKKHT